MTPEQQRVQIKRLSLEEQLFNAQVQLGELARACTEHVIIKGKIIFSPRQNKIINTHDNMPDNWNDGCYHVSCAICGKGFGWHCPVNPKGYCEYDINQGENCIHCHISTERK